VKKNEVITAAALEGGLVMLLEVSSPLIVAPVLGSSVNIWACLISISIAALALGYFLGGKKAGNGKDASYVVSVFMLNAVILCIGWALLWLQNNYSFGFNAAYFSWLIIFVVLFLPLVLFGSTTPVLIAWYNNAYKGDDETVGRIYSISTVGGIVFSILAGFYFIPSFGLSGTLLVAVLLTALLPFISYLRVKRTAAFVPLGLLVVFCVIAINKRPALPSRGNLKLLEYSEGINGQLIVADIKRDDKVERMLFINRMGQTWYNVTDNNSVWGYPNYITSLGSMFPEGSNSLVLGLGGGVVSRQLNVYCKHNVDAVELDNRIIEISKKDFGLKSSGVKMINDDARRFVKKSKKKYDFIVLDIFNGEILPSHGLSKESFEDVKKLLQPGGVMVINFNGFLNGKEGRSGRSLYKTLAEAGFKTKLFATNEAEESERNILYVSYVNEPDWSKTVINVNTKEGEYKIGQHFLDASKIDLADALVITDDKPMMEQLNRFAAARWREDYYKNFTLKFKEEYDLPLTN
jgi:spermidine synthase